MVPRNFLDWKKCVEQDCGLALTTTFIKERIHGLSDETEQHTKDFIRCYGDQYRQLVLSWFSQALKERLSHNTHRHGH